MSWGKMVLPHDNIVSVVQPNLGFQDDQEDINSSLNTFVWRNRRNIEHYRQARQVLEEDEARAKALKRAIQRRELHRAQRRVEHEI